MRITQLSKLLGNVLNKLLKKTRFLINVTTNQKVLNKGNKNQIWAK